MIGATGRVGGVRVVGAIGAVGALGTNGDDDDELAGDAIAAARLAPRRDRGQVAGARARARRGVEARPRQRDRAADEGSVARFVAVVVNQRRRNAAQLDFREAGVAATLAGLKMLIGMPTSVPSPCWARPSINTTAASSASA